MKKHLIAASVLAALSAPVLAQVTIDGYFETSYGTVKNGVTKATGMQGAQDVYAGSDINFRVTEDLGGGLKAGILLTLEFDESSGRNINSVDFAPGTQATIGSTANFDRTWRNAVMFIEGDWGNLRAGRFVATHRDLGGVYRFNGDFGRISSVFNTFGNRPNNQIQYTSPVFNGFRISVAEARTEQGVAESIEKQAGIILTYTQGPLRIAASSSEGKTTAGVTNKEQAIGGSYAFGNVRVGLAHFMDKPAAVSTDTEGTTLQLDVALGQGINVFGSYNKYSSDVANADGSGVSAGVSKALSKRTKVFAVYNKDSNDPAATWVYRGGFTPGAGGDSSRAVVGLAHSF